MLQCFQKGLCPCREGGCSYSNCWLKIIQEQVRESWSPATGKLPESRGCHRGPISCEVMSSRVPIAWGYRLPVLAVAAGTVSPRRALQPTQADLWAGDSGSDAGSAPSANSHHTSFPGVKRPAEGLACGSQRRGAGRGGRIPSLQLGDTAVLDLVPCPSPPSTNKGWACLELQRMESGPHAPPPCGRAEGRSLASGDEGATPSMVLSHRPLADG